MEAPTPFKRKQNMVQFESDWIVVCFHLDGRKKCQKPNLSSNMSLTDSVWLMWWLDLGGVGVSMLGATPALHQLN